MCPRKISRAFWINGSFLKSSAFSFCGTGFSFFGSGTGATATGAIGVTGAVLTVKTLHELERRQARYGLVTLCIGGGMGIAAVLERVA